ncbi:MAG: hypothetical protein RJQ04_08095 [Longimicrobiales bacterium]
MNRPAGSPSPISDRNDRSRRSGLASRRVLVASFGVSVALHVIALLLYPAMRPAGVREFVPFLLPSASSALDGMEVIQVVEVDELDSEAPAAPVMPTEVQPSGVDADAPSTDPGQGIDPLVPPGPTAAERLRITLEDRRLWAPVDPSLTELSTEQRLELELAGRLEEWNDSVRAAEAARRGLTDWTYTDDDGGRWGVADGKLYLGDLALPFPFSFGMNPQQLQEAMAREREWLEIERGKATGELRDSWKERAQAIRERRDRERLRARPDTSGTPR